MFLSALKVVYECVRLSELGHLEDQTDRPTRSNPSSFAIVCSAQDLYYLYMSYARIRCKRGSYREGVYR